MKNMPVVSKNDAQDSRRRARLQCCSQLVVSFYRPFFRVLTRLTTKNELLLLHDPPYHELKNHDFCSHVERDVVLYDIISDYKVTTT